MGQFPTGLLPNEPDFYIHRSVNGNKYKFELFKGEEKISQIS